MELIKEQDVKNVIKSIYMEYKKYVEELNIFNITHEPTEYIFIEENKSINPIYIISPCIIFLLCITYIYLRKFKKEIEFGLTIDKII